jgi:hypothetical protein
MGRLLFMLIVVLLLVFISIEVSRIFNMDKRSHKDNRKSFDEDIEAVANKIKKRG